MVGGVDCLLLSPSRRDSSSSDCIKLNRMASLTINSSRLSANYASQTQKSQQGTRTKHKLSAITPKQGTHSWPARKSLLPREPVPRLRRILLGDRLKEPPPPLPEDEAEEASAAAAASADEGGWPLACLLEVMPMGTSLSPTLLNTMRRLARRETVARMASTLMWKLGCKASIETTSGVSAGTDFLRGLG